MTNIITVRDVDQVLFREFKADAVRKGMKVGTALNFAMIKFRQELRKKRPIFSDIKTVKWPEGKVNISEKMDEILYGE